MTNITAQLNYLRIAPRKARLVADLVRGQTVDRAESQLRFLPQKSAKPILKLLNSAIANAKTNFNKSAKNLYVKSIRVDGGPPLKRSRPRSRGMTNRIRKETSHISLILAESAKIQISKSKLQKKHGT